MKINRIAVIVCFFVCGFVYGNWTARLPLVQQFFDLSNALLGTLLFVAAMGAIIAMPLAGWFTTKYGSMKVLRVASLSHCALLPFLVLSDNVWTGGVIFWLLGFTSGAMDVSMNGQGILVERQYKKSIMASFHAVFSIGMATGGGAGALFTQLEWDLFSHFSVIATFNILACLWASMNLIDDKPAVTEKQSESAKIQLPTKAILPFGIIAFCAMTGEGSIADWSAIFMNKIVGETETFSAMAFGFFATAMTIGRLLGDKLISKFGKYKILIFSSLFSFLGMSLVLFVATTYVTLFGLVLTGLGLATVVPIAYSTAGNMKDIEPSVGISMVTTIGYAGFFIAPPTIGFLADEFSLTLGLCFPLTLILLMLVIVFKLKKVLLAE